MGSPEEGRWKQLLAAASKVAEQIIDPEDNETTPQGLAHSAIYGHEKDGIILNTPARLLPFRHIGFTLVKFENFQDQPQQEYHQRLIVLGSLDYIRKQAEIYHSINGEGPESPNAIVAKSWEKGAQLLISLFPKHLKDKHNQN